MKKNFAIEFVEGCPLFDTAMRAFSNLAVAETFIEGQTMKERK